MKHFLVTLVLTVPLQDLEPRHLHLHDLHFRTGCELGLFLSHGPLEPATGWLAIARSESGRTLANFLEENPLLADHLATATIQEFKPAEFPVSLRGWVNPAEWDQDYDDLFCLPA